MTRRASHRPARTLECARINGARPAATTALDTPQLLEVLGRIKVWELARLGEISVERLIAMVVRASGMPRIPALGSVTRSARKKRHTGRKVVAPVDGWTPPIEPPVLEGLSGRITLEEIDALVDYWALSVTLHEHAWNVTQAAARLGIARRGLRRRWRKVRDLSPDLMTAAWSGRSRPPMSLPAPPRLQKLLADGVKLAEMRNAARRWLVTCTLALKGGNRTYAAETLGTSRRYVREQLAAYAAEHGPQ